MKKSKLKQQLTLMAEDRDNWKTRYEMERDTNNSGWAMRRTDIAHMEALKAAMIASDNAWREEMRSVVSEQMELREKLIKLEESQP